MMVMVFSLVITSIVHTLVHKVYVALFRMLLVLFLAPPLMVPYIMPDPTLPTHTNPLSVLSADRSQSFYVTPALSCCLSIVPYICCHLHHRCLVF